MDQVIITIETPNTPQAEKMLQIKNQINQQYATDTTVVSSYRRDTRIAAHSETLPIETLEQIKQTATDIINS